MHSNLNTFKTKLRHTLPTFIVTILSVVIFFCLSRWTLTTIMDIQMKEVLWEIYIPVLLPWIPCIYFLNRKLSSPGIDIKIKSRYSMILFSVLTTIGMLFVLNRYTNESVEILRELPDVTRLSSVKTTKYFKLDKYSVNPSGGHHFEYKRGSRRNRTRLRLNLYIALPLLKNKNEGISGFPRFWYGLKFTMKVNSSRSEASKRALEQEFLKESQQKIKAMTFDDEDYFELIANAKEKKPYQRAIHSIPIPKIPAEYFVLTPYFKSFNHNARIALYWFLAIFVFGNIIFMVGLLDASLTKKPVETTNS